MTLLPVETVGGGERLTSKGHTPGLRPLEQMKWTTKSGANRPTTANLRMSRVVQKEQFDYVRIGE